MTVKRKRLVKGVELEPTDLSSEDLTREGEVAYDSSDDKLKYRDSAATRELVNTDEAQTLSNKSIDADNSTITNLETDNLKAGVLNTDLSGPATDQEIPSALAVKTALEGQNEASEINYDNSTSGLVATNVQSAIDEVEDRLDTTETDISNGQTALTDHLNDTEDAHDASAISVVPAGNLAADDVQEALEELQTDLDTRVVDGGTFTNGSVITPQRLDVKQDTLANLETYALTATNGQIVFATDEQEMFQIIGNALEPIGGGGATQFDINQTAHGFIVGDGIYHNGTTWVKGQANNSATLAYYVVIEVEDVDNFSAADFGRVEVPSHGFTVGEYFFLSDSVAGQPTSIEPSSGFSNPLFYVEDANTLQIKCLRPGAVAGITLDSLDDVSVPSPTANQVLAYNDTLTRWEAADAVSNASDVTTDNSGNSLTATDAQASFDEVAGRLDATETATTTNQTDIATTDAKSTNSAKGDLQTHNGTDFQSLPLGADGQFLIADSSEATGLKYTDTLAGTFNPVTDWQTYTPSIIEGLGTITNDSFRYRKVGDTIEFEGSFTTGTTTSTEARIGLPEDFQIDGIYNIIQYVGSIDRDGSASTAHYVLLASSGNSYVNIGVRSGGLGQGLTPTNGNAAFGNGEEVSFFARVKVAGLSSEVSAAVQGTNLKEFERILSTDVTALGSIAELEITGLTIGNRYRINFQAGIRTISSVAAGVLRAEHDSNVLCLVDFDSVSSDNNGRSTAGTSATFTATASNVTLNYIDGSSNEILLGNGTKNETFVQITEEPLSRVITGVFEQISSSDLTVVRASGNAGTALTANVTNIDYTEIEDNKGAWDGTSFTAPRTADYSVAGSISLTAGVLGVVEFYINGVIERRVGGVNETRNYNGFYATVRLQEGDILNLRYDQNATLNDTTEPNVRHWLHINELPTTESIVQNLNTNNNFETTTKFLSADVNSDALIPDLTLNNLEVGRAYEINMQLRTVRSATGTDNIGVFVINGTEELMLPNHTHNNSGGSSVVVTTHSVKFIANATTLTFTGTSISANSVIGADSVQGRGTFVQLTELPSNTILNSNKFA